MAIPRIILDVIVPMFMFISGYLYFFRIEIFDTVTYLKKQKKRIYSLLLPYIIWNIIAIPFMVMQAFGSLYHEDGASAILNRFVFYFTHPSVVFWGRYELTGEDVFGSLTYSLWSLDGPLWFVRDLFLITMLTPIIYFAVKRLRYWLLIMIFIFVDMGMRPIASPRLSALFWFSLGAYLSINSISLDSDSWSLTKQMRKLHIQPVFIVGILSAITLLIYFYFIDNLVVEIIVKHIFILFTILFIPIFTAWMIKNYSCKVFKNIESLSKYGFIIFAFHVLFPLFIVKYLLGNILISPSYSQIVNIIGVNVVSCLTVFLCVVLYWILDKLCPNINLLLNGKAKPNKAIVIQIKKS